MAQIPYRANLSAAIFPMTLARAGRSVIIPQADQNYDRRVDPAGEQKDPGIPQVIYAENVLPTVNGYQSVGYSTAASTLPYADMAILEIKMPGVSFPEILAFQVGGSEIYRWSGVSWGLVTWFGPASSLSAEIELSFAVLKGKVYIFHDQKLFEYAISGLFGTITDITSTVTPAGFLLTVKGITAAYGYLVALSTFPSQSIAYSSTTTPTDFVPSLISGAGSAEVANIQGVGQFLRASPEGFFLYTDNNIIAATYTGNARYPFRFTPIQDSQGVKFPWEVYSDVDESVQYSIGRGANVWANGAKQASLIGPEVSDYLERNYVYDDFNYATNTFTERLKGQGEAPYRIYQLNSRYIFISYKEATGGAFRLYDAAIVYDVLLQRYGRIKKRHSHLVTAVDPISGKLQLGLINNFSKEFHFWNLVVSSSDQVSTSGVLVLGKIQYVRSRRLCLDEISVESGQTIRSSGEPLPQPGSMEVLILPTANGKDFLPAQTPWFNAEESSEQVSTYFSTAEGRNISVLIKGAFDLVSVEMHFHLGGDN